MKYIPFLLLSSLLLCACTRSLPQEQMPPKEPQIIVSTDPVDTPARKDPEEPVQALPYMEKIEKTTVEIMNGPGYDSEFVAVIDPGTYTIVEETTDDRGLLWGRLKSGIGWIDLTYSREVNNIFGPITMEECAADIKASHTFVQDGFTDWGSHYLITTAEKAASLQLSTCEFTASGPAPAKVIYTLPSLLPGETLRVTLLFYGDLTNYALTYTDPQGSTHTCTLMHSGRDGSLVLQEHPAGTAAP